MTEEERREMARNNYAAQMEMLGYQTDGNPKGMVEIVRCKDCKHQHEYRTGSCPYYTTYGSVPPDDWFCADVELKEGR